MISNRSIKFLLLFLTLFALQMAILFVLLLRPQIASAATIGVRARPDSNHSNCPCSDKYTPPSGQTKKVNETIRLFIPIPGVTDGCGYLCDINGDKKGDVVDYVVAIYKFLVGAAAIMAVFMIMIGGYQWIFAMGSSSAIESAKDTIKSALFGLLLTLFSYQVLHFINPRLTDVVLPDVEEIGRMQIGGYLCGGDDLLVNDVNFNTLLVGAFAEAIKDGEKFRDTAFAKSRGPTADTEFKIPSADNYKYLMSGLNPAAAKDILKCDNEAKSYQVPETKGGTTYKNPLGPEVKIAHINIAEVTNQETNKKETKVIGIDCFYSLCDTSDKSLLDPKSGVARANIDTLKNYAEDIYIKSNGYTLDKNTVEIYNSVSTRVEPKGGGCYGSFCDPAGEGLTLCLSRTGIGIGCWNMSQLCKDTDKNMCEETDQILQASIADAMKTGVGGLPIECGAQVNGDMNPERCHLGPKFDCPFGYTRISNYIGLSSTKFSEENQDGCWEQDGDNMKAHNCFDNKGKIQDSQRGMEFNTDIFAFQGSTLAVDEVSAVCCQEKTQGVCFPDFDRAYEHQTFKYITKVCDDRLDKTKPSCIVKTKYNYDVEWTGTCQPQTGFIDDTLAENVLVCMPPKEIANGEPKVCHLGKKDKVMYETWEGCASRNLFIAWHGFYLKYPGSLIEQARKGAEFDCESYILPSDYPCLDLPAAGEFGEEKSGAGDGGGGTGDITGKVDNVVAYISSHSEVERAITTETQALQSLADWPFQSFPVGLIGSVPVMPMSIALAENEIDPSKFVVVLMAREIGGYKLDDPQKPPEKFCSPNPNGTVDCGLMQVNSQIQGTCPQTCEDLNLFIINENIKKGVSELIDYFNNPLCGTNTSCQMTKDNVDGLKRYRWIYMITKYNGGNNANAASDSCVACPSGQPADRCNKIPDDKQGCFIGKVDAVPTQVECPYNDSCGIEDGEYRTITYTYVLDMIEGYKYLVQ